MPDLDPKTPLKDALEPDDPKSPLKTAAVVRSRTAPVCPQCGTTLDVYEGTNPHKQGTGWCPAGHGRQLLDPTAPPPTEAAPVAA